MSGEPRSCTQAAPELKAQEAAGAEHGPHAARPDAVCTADGCTNSGTRRRLGGYEFGTHCRRHHHEALKRFVSAAYQEMVERWPCVEQMHR